MEQPRLNLDNDRQGKECVRIEAGFQPLIPRFMANRKKEVADMQAALAGRDFETVRRIAHGMKGAGGSYGFDRVTEMAAAIEQAAKARNAGAIGSALPTLSAYLNQVEIVYE